MLQQRPCLRDAAIEDPSVAGTRRRFDGARCHAGAVLVSHCYCTGIALVLYLWCEITELVLR